MIESCGEPLIEMPVKDCDVPFGMYRESPASFPAVLCQI
ncbi:hypothetical protein Cul210932_0592 [Corynebacterium ulcerans]|uniref:Uncharacterized protein n=1 Tax=Corynebacterium ulcerans FRC58 TaxID=1408268 RepID=A0ABM5TZB1_CORUL|nr:hypothetical protein Cul210932_0592 [Corynebacterium ulcerans]AIU91191.1 Hypothetical protein Cul05146_0606 [Corynebacterium ulcerans]AKA96117.1 Hypothetical protein CUL131002_0569 [Corynebacterium ulcerans]AKN76485.1 Hypothetical protein CulFRC58_0631 [Corynebacterium ulcerans FRC58]ALD94325.1 Hypothetical protein Cul131001_0600 [Corynebacterium ulcerans]